MKFHDMSCICDSPDKCDYIVEVGSIVGFREEYANSYNYANSYKIVGLPDLGNMVEMQEISDTSGHWTEWQINPNKPIISVEPWKIGLV